MRISEMTNGIRVQMRQLTFGLAESISILNFPVAFKSSYDRNMISGGATMWIVHPYGKTPTAFTIKAMTRLPNENLKSFGVHYIDTATLCSTSSWYM